LVDVLFSAHMTKASFARLLARFGLAFCFLAFGVWEMVNPLFWSAFVPEFVAKMIDPMLLARIHGVVLTVVGLGVLFDFYLVIFSALATFIMFEISLSLLLESGFGDVFVRDVAILFMAGAIFVNALEDAKK